MQGDTIICFTAKEQEEIVNMMKLLVYYKALAFQRLESIKGHERLEMNLRHQISLLESDKVVYSSMREQYELEINQYISIIKRIEKRLKTAKTLNKILGTVSGILLVVAISK